MSKARYQITEVSNGLYDLFEDGMLIGRFSRKSFREDLHCLGRGNGWLGSILRLLNRAYPSTDHKTRSQDRSSVDGVLQCLGERGIAEYLRNKGYTVYKPLNVSDNQLINYLQTKGYVVATEIQTLPLISQNLENNNGCESEHSGSRSLCSVGVM